MTTTQPSTMTGDPLFEDAIPVAETEESVDDSLFEPISADRVDDVS